MTMATDRVCPACGSEGIKSYADGDAEVCRECGLVLNTIEGAETITVEQREDLLEDGDDQPDAEWHTEVTIRDRSERDLVELLQQVDSFAAQLPVSERQRIDVAELVADVWKEGFFHGRTKEGGIGAVYAAISRRDREPIPLATLADIVGVNASNLRQVYRSLNDSHGLNIEPVKAAEYVSYFTTQLEVDCEDRQAIEILEDAAPCPGNPVGKAGAGVYLATNTNSITYREVGEVARMTKQAIWENASRLRERTSII